MKQNFINRQLREGGFSEQEKSELQASLKVALKEVETAIKSDNLKVVGEELKKHADTINESMKQLSDKLVEKDSADVENQKALDEVLVKIKTMQDNWKSNRENSEVKSLNVAIAEALSDKENAERVMSVRKGNRAVIELKGLIDMSMPMTSVKSQFEDLGDISRKASTTSIITGDSLVTYGSRQALKPAQRVNFRDLIPTTISATGTYVHFAEGNQTGAAGVQTTENTAKANIDYAWTEVKTVNKYIAGIQQFSKQLMRSLPYLSNTLPRLLQRDFFKAENRYFWDRFATVNASGGASTATVETDDVKQIMDYLTNMLDSDYMPAFGMLRYTALNRLNKLLYTNGYYQGSGGVLSQQDGSIKISGIPIIPVTFIPTKDVFAAFDADYVERIEVEGLKLEFFEQDSDNVQKNMITARIECFEEINPMLAAATLIGDLGNSSTS